MYGDAIRDLKERYRFYGSSLRLIEELANLTAAEGDVETRKAVFQSAVNLAPVNPCFFRSFFEDPTFVAALSRTPTFLLHYKAACLTASADLWRDLVDLALSPKIDFSSEDLSSEDLSSDNSLPILFPAPDLFLGVVEFPLSLALATQQWSDHNPTHIEESGCSAFDALLAGHEVSPMSQLLVSALSVAGQHPTISQTIWKTIRTNLHSIYKDSYDKWQSNTDDNPNNRQLDQLLWNTFCESWRLRLLYYRQLSLASVDLSEVLDEYRLFEADIPDSLRILEMPMDTALNQPENFRNQTLRAIQSRIHNGQTDAQNAANRRDRCIMLAQTLVNRSEKQWRRRKTYEMGVKSEELEDASVDEDTSFMGEEWEGGEARRRVNSRWTQYIQFEESQLAKLSERAGSSSQQASPMPNSPDVLVFLDKVFGQARNLATVQKRQVVVTYIRAIHELGDVRLDLFEGLWEFFHRAASDNLFVPSSKWLNFWLKWLADTSARHQPLKSCCWRRGFHVIKRIALSEYDDLEAFVELICSPSSGLYWKSLVGPPWWQIYDIFQPGSDLRIPSPDVLQNHTSEFLYIVTEVVSVTEETFRLLHSQDALFIRGGSESTDLSNQLYQAVSVILEMTEERLYCLTNYLSTFGQESLSDLLHVHRALFTSLLACKILRGIFIARLAQSLEELFHLFTSIDRIMELFMNLVRGPDSELKYLASIWNLKIGLALAVMVCTDVKYFSLKGSWLSSCLMRGELDPRVYLKTLLSQPVDQSFNVVLQRLQADKAFAELRKRQRPTLLEQIKFVSEYSAVACSIFKEKHPIYLLFDWLARLAPCIDNGEDWIIPEEEVPEDDDLLPPYSLPPASMFPKLGEPVRVALDELKERPFHTSSRRNPMTSGTEMSADLASVSSNSSSNSSTEYMRYASRASPRPPISPDLSRPVTNSPLLSPSRRLSAEDMELLTRATLDGHEAALPGLAPSVPPQLLSDEALDSNSTSQSRQAENVETEEESLKPVRRVGVLGPFPQLGHHHLQKQLESREDQVTVQRLLGSGHTEWNTLYVSNLEASVTKEYLEHELKAWNVRNYTEIRIVKDHKNKSRGFAYIDFMTSDDALAAQTIINGKKLQQLPLKALVSVPSTAVYEEKVLFVSQVPEEVVGEDIKEALDDLSKRIYEMRKEQREFTRKRLAVSSEAESGSTESNDPKRARVSPRDSSSADESMVEAPNRFSAPAVQGEHEMALEMAKPWRVVDVRLIATESRNHKGYGYVELDSSIGVLDVLNWQKQRANELIVKGATLLFAPSVPKKKPMSRVPRAPKSTANKGVNENGSTQKDLARTLFISNIPWSMKETKLKELLEAYGPLSKLSLPADPERKGRNKGFAFAEYLNALDATMAISGLNNYQPENSDRQLSVCQSERSVTSKNESKSKVLASKEEVLASKEDGVTLSAQDEGAVVSSSLLRSFEGKRRRGRGNVKARVDLVGSKSRRDGEVPSAAAVSPSPLHPSPVDSNEEFKKRFLR